MPRNECLTLPELAAYHLGDLPDAELLEIGEHLEGCACCQREVQTLDGLSDEQVDAYRASALAGPLSGDAGPPARVGDYEILGEIGRGGMGVVYRARHAQLRRVVALKMLLGDYFVDGDQRLRFRAEAEAVARLQHPNIVQLFEIGEHRGETGPPCPYLCFEFVEGGNLAQRLTGPPAAPAQAAAWLQTLAGAAHAAHQQGIIHRDLKPANVLLSHDGQPKICDFGVAKLTSGSDLKTLSGMLVGTAEYMAPEQAEGKRAATPATDVYALGAILYEMLTGKPPFRGVSTLDTLNLVRQVEPVPPRRLLPKLPIDLETICLKCLEKEGVRRYPSALALAEDLERFREGKQVMARPVGAVARLARACRRRPLVALLVALLAVSLFGGFAGVTWKWLDANEQRDLANAHAQRADGEKQAALYQAYRASLAAAGAALENHDVAGAARNLKLAPEDLHGWEWQHLHNRLDDSSAVVSFPSEEGGFLLAAPDRLRVGVLTGAGVRITDLEGGETRTVALGSERGLTGAAVTQTRLGLRITAWVGKTALDVIDDAGQVRCRIRPTTEGISRAVVSPDCTRLCVQEPGKRRRLVLYDATSGKQTAICDGHDDATWNFRFSPDGSRLASVSEDRTARVWDASTGALLATCRGHTSKVLRVAFSPDGARLVTASSDGTVRQWDVETGRQVEPPYDRHANEVYAVAYSPDGQWVASAGEDRAIRVWRARGGQDMAVLHGHTERVVDVTFAEDARRLASASWRSPIFPPGDDTVRLWEIDAGATLPVLRGHTNYVYPVAYSPDGRWLASGSWDRTVRLWDAATGELCATLPHRSSVWDLAFGPDGTWLVTGCNPDDRLRIWDVATARVRREIPLADGNFSSLTVSPDGTRVAATSFLNQKLRTFRLNMIEVASGKSLFTTEGASLAYSRDGRWLAILGADDKTVVLLDARTHQSVARFSGHESSVHKAAFSPDSRTLASCSRDQTVRLWQVDPLSQPSSREEEGQGRVNAHQVLRGHSDEVFAIAFHPDGTRLATAGRDGAILLWDLARGENVVRLPGHKSYIWSLAFSPDGTTLASGSGDSTVRLWDTAPLKARYQARRDAAALRGEAEQLVEQLWREKNDPEVVVKAIRGDRILSDALRHAALRAVLRRAQPPEPAPGHAHVPP